MSDDTEQLTQERDYFKRLCHSLSAQLGTAQGAVTVAKILWPTEYATMPLALQSFRTATEENCAKEKKAKE